LKLDKQLLKIISQMRGEKMTIYIIYEDDFTDSIQTREFKKKDDLINFLIDEIRSYEGWFDVKWGKKDGWHYLIPEGNDLQEMR